MNKRDELLLRTNAGKKSILQQYIANQRKPSLMTRIRCFLKHLNRRNLP